MCNDIIIMSLLKDIDSTLHVTIGLIPRPLSLGGRGLGTRLCGYRLCSSLIPRLSCMGLGMRLRLKLVCGSYPALFPVSPWHLLLYTVHTTVPTVCNKKLGKELRESFPQTLPSHGRRVRAEHETNYKTLAPGWEQQASCNPLL